MALKSTELTLETMGLTGITKGEWEAENNVIVIKAEQKPTTTILYEANVIGGHDINGHDINSDVNARKAGRERKTKLETELETNARAIAAVPDMLQLLEDILTASAEVYLSEAYAMRIEDLLAKIYLGGTNFKMLEARKLQTKTKQESKQ